jgi:hypothetical protein
LDFDCPNPGWALGRILLLWGGERRSQKASTFQLISQGFDNAGINNSIKGSFDFQATKDAAQAVVGEDGRVKLLQQVEAEQVLLNIGKTQH